nr:1-acyl-sn-glycerol-3-phosphate acyltransferase epsilon isoform X1 [Hydra vulgaris]
MTTFLLPLASFRSLVPPTILFGLAPHYFLINSSAQILKLFLPPTVNEKIDEFIYHTYQSLVTYFFSTFIGSKIIFYGDSVIGNTKENVLYISNHQSAIDWSLVNFISIHCGSMGQIRYILKNLLKYLPFYGIYFMQHGCVFVQTKGRVNDEDDLRRRLQKFKKDRVNGYWLVIFPEGTRFSENKTHLVEKSSQLAKQAGITPFDNVLFPRTKGVELCIEELTNLDAIYDITLGFKTPWLGVEVKKEGPSLLEFVSVYGREIHIDFQRIDIVDVPKIILNAELELNQLQNGHQPRRRQRRERVRSFERLQSYEEKLFTGEWTPTKTPTKFLEASAFYFNDIKLTPEGDTEQEQDENPQENFQDHQQETRPMETLCKICLALPLEVVVLPCRHFYMCLQCSDNLANGGNKRCPICRSKIENFLNVFVS